MNSSGALKILRNCFFPTPQRFLVLIVFGHLHILRSSTRLLFFIAKKHGVMCRSFYKKSHDNDHRQGDK